MINFAGGLMLVWVCRGVVWLLRAHPGTRSAVNITTCQQSERTDVLANDSQILMWESYETAVCDLVGRGVLPDTLHF